jgi:hypothetical protein
VTFARVSNGIADIGAFERQATGGPALPGDYNGNTVVDTADYVVWRNTRDTVVAPYSGADGNGDEQINSADYDVWRANFGRVLGTAAVLPAASPAAAVAPPPALPSAATPREAAFVGLIGTERPRRAEAPAKFANHWPHLWRNPLELLLIDSFDATARLSPQAAGELPRDFGEPNNASDSRAVDELLADWPTAIRCAVSF